MCVTSISIGFHLNGAGTAKQNAKEMRKILGKHRSLVKKGLRGSKNAKRLDESPKIEADRCTLAAISPDKPIPIMPRYRRQSMKFMGVLG